VVSAVVGVAVSAVVPRLATGPLVVLASAFIFAFSFVAAPGRGWWARHRRQHDNGIACDAPAPFPTAGGGER
jgi:hypothetical protein